MPHKQQNIYCMKFFRVVENLNQSTPSFTLSLELMKYIFKLFYPLCKTVAIHQRTPISQFSKTLVVSNSYRKTHKNMLKKK